MILTLMYALFVIPIILLLVVYYPAQYLLHWIENKFPRVLFTLKDAHTENKNFIGLTIDDAPSQSTLLILAVLQKYRIKATWFVIGQYVLDQGAPIVQKLLENGQELGNHTMSNKASWRMSHAEFQSSLQQTEQILKASGWKKRDSLKNWFRPGSGWFTTKMIDIAESSGYRTVLGTCYPHDPFVLSACLNAWFILRRVKPGDIIIIHDRPWTISLLEIILPQLQHRGFQIAPLGEIKLQSES